MTCKCEDCAPLRSELEKLMDGLRKSFIDTGEIPESISLPRDRFWDLQEEMRAKGTLLVVKEHGITSKPGFMIYAGNSSVRIFADG